MNTTAKRHAEAAILVALLLSSVGCATGVNSPTESVLISSEPMGANVVVDDRFYTTTPGKVRLSRLSPHIIHIQKAGYEPAKIELTRGMSWWVFADISCLFWIVSCVSQDVHEGGFFTLDEEVHVRLRESATAAVVPAHSIEPPPAPIPTSATAPLDAFPEPGVPSTEASEPVADSAPPPAETEPSLQAAPKASSEPTVEPALAITGQPSP